MKCSKCNKKAEFDSPEKLCESHWLDWWLFEVNSSAKQKKQLKKHDRKVIRKNKHKL